jgi:hypothetical protein
LTVNEIKERLLPCKVLCKGLDVWKTARDSAEQEWPAR